jgi:hypothetical protein
LPVKITFDKRSIFRAIRSSARLSDSAEAVRQGSIQLDSRPILISGASEALCARSIGTRVAPHVAEVSYRETCCALRSLRWRPYGEEAEE